MCAFARTRSRCVNAHAPALQDLHESLYKAVGVIALQTIDFPVHNQANIAFTIQRHPVQRVFVKTHVAKDAMSLVPSTLRLDSKVSEKCVELKVGSHTFAIAPCISKSCVGEYWALRRVADRKQANSEVVMRKVSVPLPTKPTIEVVVPIIRNFKAIKENEEVVLFKCAPPAVAKKRPQVTLSVDGPDAKKRQKE